MGALKPLLPYGSGTVIQAVVRSLRASPVDQVLVVLGHRSPEIAANLAGTGAETVFNPRYAEGMLTSVQAGLAAAPPDARWFVIALADQPWIRPETVALLIERAERPDTPAPTIVVPSYGGRRGHPLVLHASHREEIMGLAPEAGLRELMRRHPGGILHVEVEDERVLLDLDTPEDYRREVGGEA